MCAPMAPMLLLGGLQAGMSIMGNNAAAKAQTQGIEQAKRQERMRGDYEVSRLERQRTQRQGNQIAAAASSGLTMGSFEDVIDDTYTQGLLDENVVRYNSNIRIAQLDNEKNRVKSEKRAGNIASGLSFAGTAFKGFGQSGKGFIGAGTLPRLSSGGVVGGNPFLHGGVGS